MPGPTIDVRELPPSQRHPKIHNAFDDLESGEELTLINDHDPKPLFYEMQAEVDAFDPEGYNVERQHEDKFVATFPKK
ncbi:Uncharacterized conserved protein [Haloplanus vescus]|uniref:Uncharacterized conserved protein n=1 Tax=Haloplanus vescus TaxID=555874 RepID=A0A1H3W8Z9_9EURY|nr:DUF2249 domain-containing protein [Haloplanus vescus]SDZ83440.1 Uncharacterized conserved protein [Haloplanus vescus]